MRKGFTLMELIIVVIIVGILAAIALPQFFKTAERARASEGVNTLGALRAAQQRYYAEHGATCGNTTDTSCLDVNVTASDMRYFDQIYLKSENIRTDNGYIARVRRNGTSNSYGTYYLYIRPDGNIFCGGDSDGCTAAGY